MAWRFLRLARPLLGSVFGAKFGRMTVPTIQRSGSVRYSHARHRFAEPAAGPTQLAYPWGQSVRSAIAADGLCQPALCAGGQPDRSRCRRARGDTQTFVTRHRMPNLRLLPLPAAQPSASGTTMEMISNKGHVARKTVMPSQNGNETLNIRRNPRLHYVALFEGASSKSQPDRDRCRIAQCGSGQRRHHARHAVRIWWLLGATEMAEATTIPLGPRKLVTDCRPTASTRTARRSNPAVLLIAAGALRARSELIST